MRGKESPRLPLCTQRRVTPQGTSVPLGRSPELCVTPRPSCASPPRKDKAESGGTPTSEGERPRGSAPLRPPARSLLPPQISHRAFLAAAADLLFMQQVPRGRTARFQPRSPPRPSPTLPRLSALRAPRCASLGAPAPSRLRGDPEKRGSAPQHGKCSAAFQVSAPQLCPAEPLAAGRTCREPQFGRDESGAGGESGAGRTPERRGPAAPRLCSEHPLPRATAPPRARPRGAPRAGQRPRAGRHRVPAAVAQEMLAVPGEGSALLRSPARRLAAGRTPCSTRTPRSYFSLARLLDSGH